MALETPLARILLEKGPRQDWVADRLHVHPSVVSRWVRGKRRIPEHYLPKLAEILGVSTEDLQS